ncbi:MAG: hypothetical protein GW855_11500 [Erythrobacter sp.]|nr:hypothetical protein [Erythrobacter sp.]NCQ62767.1 hypothetical protein [Alphaproteobacteria bacterium]
MSNTTTGKTRLAIAAGLALAPLAPGYAPAAAQEPDYEFADVLAPYYAAAPQEDILDLKLGMNVDQVLLTLAHHGFEVKGDSLGRTALGRGAMRYLEARRPHEGTRPAYERILIFFDFSENPRVLAVHRESSYRRDHYPAYTTVMDALLQKYGDAPVYDTRKGEVMGAWFPKKLPRRCGPMRNNFRYFRAPQDIEQHEGCYWGLVVKVGFQRSVAGRPVEYTRSFLLDTRILDANYKETWRLAKEQADQRERQRQENTRANPAAEF